MTAATLFAAPAVDDAPRPYFESERATLYLGDARDILPALPTESVDLVLTDPPYGQAFRSNRRVERFDAIAHDTGADRDTIRDVLRECVRLVGQNRHLYVFGPLDALDGLKVTAPVSLVWDKAMMSGGDLAAPFGPAHEPVSFVVSKHRHGGQAGGDALPARIRKGSVLRFARVTGRKVRHPTEKPVPLLAELVESSSRAGELVLDPFAGVGSTGVAAILRGRRCLLVELDERYARIAVERLEAAECLADAIAAA